MHNTLMFVQAENVSTADAASAAQLWLLASKGALIQFITAVRQAAAGPLRNFNERAGPVAQGGNCKHIAKAFWVLACGAGVVMGDRAMEHGGAHALMGLSGAWANAAAAAEPAEAHDQQPNVRDYHLKFIKSGIAEKGMYGKRQQIRRGVPSRPTRRKVQGEASTWVLQGEVTTRVRRCGTSLG